MSTENNILKKHIHKSKDKELLKLMIYESDCYESTSEIGLSLGICTDFNSQISQTDGHYFEHIISWYQIAYTEDIYLNTESNVDKFPKSKDITTEYLNSLESDFINITKIPYEIREVITYTYLSYIHETGDIQYLYSSNLTININNKNEIDLKFLWEKFVSDRCNQLLHKIGRKFLRPCKILNTENLNNGFLYFNNGFKVHGRIIKSANQYKKTKEICEIEPYLYNKQGFSMAQIKNREQELEETYKIKEQTFFLNDTFPTALLTLDYIQENADCFNFNDTFIDIKYIHKNCEEDTFCYIMAIACIHNKKTYPEYKVNYNLLKSIDSTIASQYKKIIKQVI